MAPNLEADFDYLLRVLAKAQAIDVDWYAVSGTIRDQGRGAANKSQPTLALATFESTRPSDMAQKLEADFNFLMRVLSHSIAIQTDWYAVGGTKQGATPSARAKANNT
ncbi:hypothetical protein LTR70_004203 [Exophiala xenobiotica]|uniref:Uncharacterized protein n=1 Tax=Lithohypha guttulata TaxID=1690604 RepID=A0ABR0KE70_9EURO|nr:hypothetical protein LTR24_003685 [Lithohypha guttulata]KAK5321490.1 hypothetical protein LTR70_004203 [Exophiala xenobiotica]